MKVERLVVGLLETNCYVLYQNESCLVVDPGDDYRKIAKAIEGYELEGILVTHYHFDHVGALSDLLKHHCTTVFNFKTLGKQKTKSFSFEVVLNKGHKEDSVSFVFENDIFTGDFVFNEGIGRTDLPGGCDKEMQKSLDKLKVLTKNYNIYPGHGPTTTLDYEKQNNPYL